MRKHSPALVALLLLAGCGQPSTGSVTERGASPANAIVPGVAPELGFSILAVAGAAYTTFDNVFEGCLDNQTGVNCNNYSAKDRVYISGGPVAAGLSDGTYYFSVVVPGYQNLGYRDGATGNLSDTTAGGTTGDAGSGDAAANRTFTVSNHAITSYGGTHLNTGSYADNPPIHTSPNGKFIIQLSPYDDTSNAGGVYILAIAKVGETGPSDVKYDAFRLRTGENVHEFGHVKGLKYYDCNLNGKWDAGEPGIPGWPINYTDSVSGQFQTGTDGTFDVPMVADTYRFAEQPGGSHWVQTGNTCDQTYATGGASAALNSDKTYCVTVVDDSLVCGVNFGNVCIGAGGGLTLGFWSNKNGELLFNSGTDRSLMCSLNLRNANGTDFNPASYNAFRTWILAATATNMANMLSAQLSAMELNVLNGKVDGTRLIYAPGATGANTAGFMTVNALMAEANTSLGINGYTVALNATRTYQEALKNALDRGNNDLNFLQPSFGACCPVPAPAN